MENTREAASAVRRGVQTLGRRLQGERSPDGLSLTKTSMLSHLARRGELTPGELAAADRLRPQSVSRVLAELEREGYAVRVRDTTDGRQRRLRLTAAGLDALADDMRERDAWLERAMQDLLSPTERELVVLAAGLLERLGAYRPEPEASTERTGAGAGVHPGVRL